MAEETIPGKFLVRENIKLQNSIARTEKQVIEMRQANAVFQTEMYHSQIDAYAFDWIMDNLEYDEINKVFYFSEEVLLDMPRGVTKKRIKERLDECRLQKD